MAVEGFCVKCRERRTMLDPKEGLTSNGKHIVKGTCPVCGKTLCRIGKPAK